MVHADDELGETPADPGAGRPDGEAPPRWQEAARNDGDERLGARALSGWHLPEDARKWVVGSVQVPMASYCARRRKRIYCDKSLDSVYHLGLVQELFPDARMVLVFRHVMDTVASGLEASPWGFNAYGYAPYVQANPGNAVAALASYWLDHASRALSWEEEHPDVCHRVRYEDLVLHPDEIVAGIQRFLGVREDLSVLAAAFDREPARGPGDYKVEHTSGVHAASIGRGKRVPVGMLPPALLAAVNEKLEALGYDPLDRSWNAAERPVDSGGHGIWGTRLSQLMDSIVIPPRYADVGSFAVVAEDHRALRWVVEPADGAVARGDGEVEAVLTGTAEDLVLMLAGEENLGVLLRSGRIRHVVVDEDEMSSRNLMRELSGLLAVLRSGSRRSTNGRVVPG
jgi:hypothetical protein